MVITQQSAPFGASPHTHFPVWFNPGSGTFSLSFPFLVCIDLLILCMILCSAIPSGWQHCLWFVPTPSLPTHGHPVSLRRVGRSSVRSIRAEIFAAVGDPPPPMFCVTAHSKGVTDLIVVSTHSSRVKVECSYTVRPPSRNCGFQRIYLLPI